MRVLNRFALGALVLGTLCLMAEPAEGGPFRRRGGRGAAADCGCQSSGYGYAGGYAMASPSGQGYGMAQSGMGYSYASNPCSPGSTVAYGQGGYRQAGYGAYYGGQVQGASGYYQPGNIIPAGGFPSPMPGSGTSQPGDAVPANVEKVKITDGTFEPATISVSVGSTVRWTNDGKKPHTVTSDKGTWGSPEIPAGGDFTATFTKAGTFEYHCNLHKDMKGTIVVK
jgi:plastocyanin